MTCYGDRSFLVNGAAVWNSLPVAPRSPDTSLDIVKDKLSSSELSTECAFAALTNMRGINHLIVIIIILWLTADARRYDHATASDGLTTALNKLP